MPFAGRWAMLMLAGVLLGACVPGGGRGADAPAGKPGVANPMMADMITTTSLDAPTPEQAKQGAPALALPAPAPAPADPAKPIPTAEAPAKATGPAGTVAAAPPEPAPEPLSPEAVKCLKSGGLWAGTGKTGAKTCLRRTKDAGKACTKQTQCEGYCLARSRSCAPVTPMFGCNDILQADGREATLCID